MGTVAPRANNWRNLLPILATYAYIALVVWGALEFFRLRYERAVNAPTQATVYKLFPGGWAEVLALV